MTEHDLQNSAKLRDALYDALEDERTGMLGVTGTKDHMQPMTHFFDRENGCLWFISSNKTDLVGHLKGGARDAHFTVTSGKGQLYACMSGPLTIADDPEKLDELWSPMASMWFDGGKDDPEVTLLRMPLHEAAIWLNEAGTLRFGMEMVRGAVSGHDPEVGEHGVVDLRNAA